jgi:hypothetical protein
MDTPAPSPHQPDLETRVSRLEEGMGDLKVMLARIDAILPTLATGAQLAEVSGRIDVMSGRIDAMNGRIDAVNGRIDAVVPTLATAAQVSELRGRIDTLIPTLATSAEVSELRGRIDTQLPSLATTAQLSEMRGMMQNLPTAWQMMTAIVAGQCTLAALLAAIVFGVLRVTGKG